MNVQDANYVRILREAGCTCARPLLGERPGVGPRCRLCNTQATPLHNDDLDDGDEYGVTLGPDDQVFICGEPIDGEIS